MSLTPYLHLEVPLSDVEAGDLLPLPAEAHHHLTTVLRQRDGARVEVADGDGASALAELQGEQVVLRSAPVRRERLRPALVVAQALIKGRRFDEVVRQVTELDVDEVVPLVTDRCVARVDSGKAARATQRWRSIARSACEQARRPDRPHVADVTSLDELVEDLPSGTTLLAADPTGDALTRLQDRVLAAARVIVVVGPEGGLTDGELARLRGGGAATVGLGPTVLRAEHAAAAALAALSVLTERW